MLWNWLWISRWGDYWQQAELRTDGACRIMMMMTPMHLEPFVMHSALPCCRHVLVRSLQLVEVWPYLEERKKERKKGSVIIKINDSVIWFDLGLILHSSRSDLKSSSDIPIFHLTFDCTKSWNLHLAFAYFAICISHFRFRQQRSSAK